MKLLITIPCYNEEIVLEKTVFSVIEYMEKYLTHYEWRLLILENNSTDNTLGVAKMLQKKNPLILIDEVKKSGRGRALRESWSRYPDFHLYAYMDADLSTDIKDFAFIISKVAEGYDLVTGSRYVPYANVERRPLRKFLSLVYNILLRLVLGVNFKDAQCGFKAMSKKLVHNIVPKTKDNGWFWDTELMIIASRLNYKVLEVPITWKEVRDELRRSTVSVPLEVLRNLKNIWIMRRRLRNKYYGA